MDPIAELAEFDRKTVAQAKAVEQQIQAEGFAAGHIIRDVRVFRVLMPWVGTKRWDVLLPSSRPTRAWSALPKEPTRTPKN